MTASALDSGSSTTMAFDGELLNSPSDPGGERGVADGLFVFYYGVQAPHSATDRSSRRTATASTRRRQLSYKVVRPSTVTASLVGPDGVARQTQTGPRAPGTYTLDWTGRTAQGAPEPEGRWRWVVNAVDDRGQASRAERVFYLNNTLGYLRVSPSRVVVRRRGGALRVAFRLAHPATVTLKIRTVSGATVQTVRRNGSAPGRRASAGTGATASGIRAFSGPYIASVRAVNAFGPTQLERRFLVRRGR